MPTLSPIPAFRRLVRFNSRSSDRQVAILLAKQFEHSLREAQIGSLSFYIRDGHVRVVGAIPSPFDARILTGIIRKIDGVRGVEHIGSKEPS